MPAPTDSGITELVDILGGLDLAELVAAAGRPQRPLRMSGHDDYADPRLAAAVEVVAAPGRHASAAVEAALRLVGEGVGDEEVTGLEVNPTLICLRLAHRSGDPAAARADPLGASSSSQRHLLAVKPGSSGRPVRSWISRACPVPRNRSQMWAERRHCQVTADPDSDHLPPPGGTDSATFLEVEGQVFDLEIDGAVVSETPLQA